MKNITDKKFLTDLLYQFFRDSENDLIRANLTTGHLYQSAPDLLLTEYIDSYLNGLYHHNGQPIR
jgi:hypothetical protein